VRASGNAEATVQRIGRRANHFRADLVSKNQFSATTLREMEDSVTRLILHLSQTVAGETRPRSRGV
jgi:hypothetical protein